jgi:ABC-type transport system substrate-binding protein
MVLMLTALLALVLAGCTKRPNVGTQYGGVPLVGFPETPPPPHVPGKPGGVFRLGIVEPAAIDPYNAQESEGTLITENLFTELIDIGPDGSVSPGVATSWTANDNCSQWTFTLKQGTTFSNGEPVTSAAFKRGWERAAARSAASEVAYHMNEIQGFDAMQAGTAEHLSGVDASAPDRLVVTLAHPDCEFYLRTYKTVFSPVPTVAGPADNKAYNDEPIGNGPFMMDGPWQHDRGIRLKRFDGYTAGPKANLDRVDVTILPSQGGVQAEYDGFVNGTFDWARLPTPLLSQARANYEPRGEWISKKTAGTNYLLPMVTTPPLNSVAARKAISLAIDRVAIARGVFQGAQVPADAFVPPGVAERLPVRGVHRVPVRSGRGPQARPAGRTEPGHHGQLPVQHRRWARGVDCGGDPTAAAQPRAQRQLRRSAVYRPAEQRTTARRISSSRCCPPPRSARPTPANRLPETTGDATAIHGLISCSPRPLRPGTRPSASGSTSRPNNWRSARTSRRSLCGSASSSGW